MDQSFVLVSNTSSTSADADDKLNTSQLDNSWYIGGHNEDNSSNRSSLESNIQEKSLPLTEGKPLVPQDSHDINDSYDFNVNNMLGVLSEKNTSVINIAKLNNKKIASEESAIRVSNVGNDAIKNLNEQKNSIINRAKQLNEVEEIKEKLKAGKSNEVVDKAEDGITTKSVDDGYVNDTNDMDNVLKILNNKKSSILKMARNDSDNAMSMADSAKSAQKTKQLAAVLAANEEDLKIITAGKNMTKMGSIDITDDTDYKKINEVKTQAFKGFVDDNQSENQFMLTNLKTNKKAFLDAIMD